MSLNIEGTKNYIEKVFDHTNYVPALVGPKGIGKTESFKQLAEELGIQYQPIYISSLQGEDFMGLLQKDIEKGITYYLPPTFFPTQQAVDAGLFEEEGILVLEEINRGDTQTISSIFPLLAEGKINGHELAPGWKMGATMNPESIEYTTNTLDGAAKDRLIIIDVAPDMDEYATHMIESKQANDDVLSFLYENKDMLCIDKPTENMDKFPSPRAWTKVSTMLNLCDLNDNEKNEMLKGVVGIEAAASFLGYLKDKDLIRPDWEEILQNYSKQRSIVKSIIKQNRYDVLHLTIKRIINGMKMTKKHIKNINAFLDDIPEELQIVFLKQLLTDRKNDFDVVVQNMPDFSDKVLDKITEVLAA